ncbi:hypothetical protein DAPPUDRAFT_110864 [Daphnia pulex]|uniref:Uncharacterized protein n=1 Tax=Daphnia pulex TaxID=6669 RepID=E9H7E1_DAPPU|nr:hypothetical protein DAPPUDRAFT_110864 [Daphnia pulex]|eukprot:EFX72381.1 hypothetical protein DAPPUDRAFT_110864 [Daphnia pulex]
MRIGGDSFRPSYRSYYRQFAFVILRYYIQQLKISVYQQTFRHCHILINSKMVMSKTQIRAARTCRGHTENHVIVRTAFLAAARATSFMAQNPWAFENVGVIPSHGWGPNRNQLLSIAAPLILNNLGRRGQSGAGRGRGRGAQGRGCGAPGRGRGAPGRGARGRGAPGRGAPGRGALVPSHPAMVMSKIEIRAARTCRGTTENHVIVRTAFMAAARVTSFMVQVTNHREIQTALRQLFPSRFNRSNIHEYAFNCTVVHNPWAFENVNISRGRGARGRGAPGRGARGRGALVPSHPATLHLHHACTQPGHSMAGRGRGAPGRGRGAPGRGARGRGAPGRGAPGRGAPGRGAVVPSHPAMVMSKSQIRAARTCRGTTENHVIVRTACQAAARATSFMVQVANHREVQTALRQLFPSRFNRSNIHQYAFNCTVVYNPWAFENVVDVEPVDVELLDVEPVDVELLDVEPVDVEL